MHEFLKLNSAEAKMLTITKGGLLQISSFIMDNEYHILNLMNSIPVSKHHPSNSCSKVEYQQCLYSDIRKIENQISNWQMKMLFSHLLV